MIVSSGVAASLGYRDDDIVVPLGKQEDWDEPALRACAGNASVQNGEVAKTVSGGCDVFHDAVARVAMRAIRII